MIHPTAAEAQHRPAHGLSDRDFNRIAGFAHREFGLHLPPAKISHVQSRLTKLLGQTGCRDFASLCDRLEAAPTGPERDALVSALTTNVTQFFREEHHFHILADQILRPRLADWRAGSRLRIWSAGCSAGQEPCSIAMTLLDLLPEAGQLDLRILATDIDPDIITEAQRAEYPLEEAQGIPIALRRSMTEPIAGATRFRILPRVTQLIHYAELNLISDWPMKGRFDAIFCRNVAIYFDKPTQSRMWSRFADLLAPGGLLLIGHSERVSGPASTRLTSTGITAYRASPMKGPVS